MKRILLLAVMVSFAISVFGQRRYTQREVDAIEEKGRKQVKTGFIVMGVGVGISLAGFLLPSEDEEGEDNSAKGIVILAGVATVVTGIMIAVIGAQKKSRQYYKVTFEEIPQIKNGSIVKKRIPAIGLCISLGR